jgi:hypothetical protein
MDIVWRSLPVLPMKWYDQSKWSTHRASEFHALSTNGSASKTECSSRPLTGPKPRTFLTVIRSLIRIIRIEVDILWLRR